ncbi:MAG: hypothetical protein CMM52_01995 [Rhodospirillaceae bacterium]|nr:hypothetical protein [Rhodospirillaceae bacterium]|tara:strand:- start:3960 stop:4502 length:543 start_codon:yes stop_codon:yes gene_type:complete
MNCLVKLLFCLGILLMSLAIYLEIWPYPNSPPVPDISAKIWLPEVITENQAERLVARLRKAAETPGLSGRMTDFTNFDWDLVCYHGRYRQPSAKLKGKYYGEGGDDTFGGSEYDAYLSFYKNKINIISVKFDLLKVKVSTTFYKYICSDVNTKFIIDKRPADFDLKFKKDTVFIKKRDEK